VPSGGREKVTVYLPRSARLEAFLHRGKSQVECAEALGVSIRTIGRIVARMKAESRI
jgi:transposase